jgi:hypothetical protein
MFYVGKTIAVSSFVVANIVVGGTVVGLAVTAYGPAAGIAASIGIDLAFATVEGGIVLFITDDVEKAKVAFQLGAAGALLGGGLEIVALQAVKSFSKFRFNSRVWGASDGFDAVVKVTLADGTKINRSLKKFTDDLSASGFSDDQLKKLFADMDVSPRFTNFVLSGEGLVMVRAWETVFSSPVLRKDPSKLTKVSRYLDNNPSKRPAFKAEFDLTPSARQSDFVDRVSRFDDLKVANSTASFSTQGLARSDIPQTTINQMTQQASAPQYLDGVINSCSTVPVRVPVSPGDKLFKIVPKGGDTPSSVTPYWLNESELNRLATDASLEQKLGLPIVSHGAKGLLKNKVFI